MPTILFQGRALNPRGRWNPKGAFPAVYLCDSPETALAEYSARSRRMRLPDARVLPMVMAAVEARVSSALDLDTPDVAAVLQPFLASEDVHWRAIQNRREAVSQAIGRVLHQLGLNALLATTQARSDGRTIVLFPDKFSRKDHLSAPSLKILNGNIVSAVYAARGRELQNLYRQLATLMKPEEVGAWLNTGMEEFEGRRPVDLVRHGETGRLWESIYFLRAGQPD